MRAPFYVSDRPSFRFQTYQSRARSFWVNILIATLLLPPFSHIGGGAICFE